jgi:hypothetical protein
VRRNARELLPPDVARAQRQSVLDLIDLGRKLIGKVVDRVSHGLEDELEQSGDLRQASPALQQSLPRLRARPERAVAAADQQPLGHDEAQMADIVDLLHQVGEDAVGAVAGGVELLVCVVRYEQRERRRLEIEREHADDHLLCPFSRGYGKA